MCPIRLCRALASGLFLLSHAHGQLITTVVGTDWQFPADGRRGVEAPLGRVEQVATGPDGSVYIADPGNHLVLRLLPDRTIRVVAGNGLRGFSGDDGPATSASLNRPLGVAVDAQGDLYIGDTENHRIRKVSRGIISTYAGNGNAAFGGDGGPATSASLDTPAYLALDRDGNLFLVDYINVRIRRISAAGVITTIAGSGRITSRVGGVPVDLGDNGPALLATFDNPGQIAVAENGDVLVADGSNNRLRRISGGTIRTIAGPGVAEVLGDGGPATSAFLNGPAGVALNAAGEILLTDQFNQRIRRIGADGRIATLAGGGFGLSDDNVPADRASFRNPFGLAVDGAGNIYIADRDNNRIRRLAPDLRSVTTEVGNGLFHFFGENTAAQLAFLNRPTRAIPDGATRLYVSNTDGGAVFLVETGADGTRRIRTVSARAADDNARSCRGDDLALEFPTGLAVDADRSLFIADYGPDVVYRVTPDGRFTIFAGSCRRGFSGDGGPANRAALNTPVGLARGSDGSLYIAEAGNHRVRRVSPGGVITTFAGTGNREGPLGDGGSAVNASLNAPHGLAIEPNGGILIADRYHNRIRRVAPDGRISTVAGTGSSQSFGDGGAATAAGIFSPWDVAADTLGNVYITDTESALIRRVDARGIITTFAGTGRQGFSADGGTPTAAALNYPTGVAVDTSGTVYFVDQQNDRVRAVVREQAVLAIGQRELRLSGSSGGGIASGEIAVTGTFGLPYRTSFSGAPWLTVNQVDATVPGSLRVSGDPSSLAPGVYRATVSVTAPIDIVRTFEVIFEVGAAAPERLAVDSATLYFPFTQTASPLSRPLRVINEGSRTLQFRAEARTASGAPWLAVTPSQGNASAAQPGLLTVTVNPNGLGPGTYEGSIELTRGIASLSVKVVATITAEARGLRVTQTGLTVTSVVGGGEPPPQRFSIVNQGSATIPWRLEATTLSGGDWLRVTPATGRSEAVAAAEDIDVRAFAAGLAAGDYYGLISVLQEDKVVQLVTVVLNVTPDDPGPVTLPAGLLFTTTIGRLSSSQDILLYNLGRTTLTFNSSGLTLDGRSFFRHTPARGTVAPSQPARVTVQPDSAGLEPGTYTGTLNLLFSDGSPRSVRVKLVVAPGAAEQSARKANGCTPRRLVPVFTAVGANFGLAAGWPVPVGLRVADDCGAPMTTGVVHLVFSSGEPPLAMTPLGDGRWNATWQPRQPQGIANVSITAVARTGEIEGIEQIGGTVSPNARPPVILAVRNAANLAVETAMAPGGAVVAFGTSLAGGVGQASQTPLPTELGDTRVLFLGESAPLYYAGPDQVNLQLPFDAPVNTRLPIVVRRGRTYSVPQEITVSEAAPEVFRGGAGNGQAAIAHASGALVDERDPARPGEVLVIYCAGLGAVTPVVRAGEAAPSGILAQTVTPARVLIGGVEAAVQFAGLTPGFVGLYQINVVVPANVMEGKTRVIVRIGDRESGPVEVNVAR